MSRLKQAFVVRTSWNNYIPLPHFGIPLPHFGIPLPHFGIPLPNPGIPLPHSGADERQSYRTGSPFLVPAAGGHRGGEGERPCEHGSLGGRSQGEWTAAVRRPPLIRPWGPALGRSSN